MKCIHGTFFAGFLLKVLFFCGVVFPSLGEEPPACKSIGPCSGVFGAGESTAKDIHALCESVMNQDICRGVPEEYRFQCGRPDPHTHHPTPSFPETSSFPGKSSFPTTPSFPQASSFPRKRESTSHSQSNATSLDSRLHGKVHKTLSFPEASLEATPTNDALGFFKSCGVGLYEGGADILSFLWSVMKYALHPPGAVRGVARGLESEAAQSAKLYLAGEYEKALREATGPAKSVKAIGSVSGGVFGKLFDAIYGFLYREVEEFKCMNMAGRMNTICYLAVDFLIPPAAAIAFLKGGKVPGKVRESFKKFSLSPPKVLKRVQVPRALETEAGLRSRGFRDIHIAGMDEVHRMEAIADALRRNRVDPNVTHIEDFADQVEDHIAFFKRRSGAEEAIEELAGEARKMVQDKKVTYNWWMQWNLKMVEKAEDISKKDPGAIYNFSFDSDISNMRMGGFQTEIFSSDSLVFLPTTKELGVMAFNQSSSKKLMPLGLTDRVTEADGLYYGPKRFLKHDMDHGMNKYRPNLVDNKRYKDFHQSFTEKVKDLPKDQREKMENMLFIITHEYPYAVRSVSQFTDLSDSKLLDRRGEVFSSLQKILPPSLKDPVPNSNDYYNAVVHYYESMLEEFETIAREIQKSR